MTVLEAACNGGDTARWSVMWQLPNVIDLSVDTRMLIGSARGEREALTVCQAIGGAWILARRFEIGRSHRNKSDGVW